MNLVHYGMGSIRKDKSPEEIAELVGPGWQKIILSLIEDLFALGWSGNLNQIKEKFGGLRFYCPRESQAITERIGLAEKFAGETCEVSGAPGHLREELHWMRVLSDEEYVKALDIQNEREAKWAKS